MPLCDSTLLFGFTRRQLRKPAAGRRLDVQANWTDPASPSSLCLRTTEQQSRAPPGRLRACPSLSRMLRYFPYTLSARSTLGVLLYVERRDLGPPTCRHHGDVGMSISRVSTMHQARSTSFGWRRDARDGCQYGETYFFGHVVATFEALIGGQNHPTTCGGRPFRRKKYVTLSQLHNLGEQHSRFARNPACANRTITRRNASRR